MRDEVHRKVGTDLESSSGTVHLMFFNWAKRAMQSREPVVVIEMVYAVLRADKLILDTFLLANGYSIDNAKRRILKY